MTSIKKIISKLFIPFILVVAIISTSSTNSDFEISKNLDIFATLYRELNQNYVDEVQPGELMKTAIDEMLKSLDPYTVYISEADIEDFRFMTTGQYGGIGSLIQQQGNYIVITEPYEGFPAQTSGLKAGDILIEVNGKSVVGKTVSEVSDLLKGQPGSMVELVIKRPATEKNLNINIERKEIKVSDIPWSGMVDPKVGYIKLNSFTMNSGNEVKNAFDKLKSGSPNMEGIILDLRNNGGGLLSEAVNIANIFVDKGTTVVLTKGKLSDSNKTYKTLNNAVDKNIRLVVLINGYSASASEIVAGFIQDVDRGVIIGEKSYGKGLVQNVIPLTYNTSLKVTVAKYYIPSGRCIQAIDYSKKINGKAVHYSDSTKQSFKTKNGRIVYDAGGILPDIKVVSDSLSDITISLLLKNHIFNFATDYVLGHPSIASPEKFELSDEEYNDFLTYLEDKEYDYKTASEQKFEELIVAMKEDKYYDLSIDEIGKLQAKISHSKQQDLQQFREEIKQVISNEIISRYYYQKGRILYDMKYDKDVKKAVEILLNQQEYKRILSGE
ncbi:MAG: peptidase S41 [Bacteroidetes bacterium HGW-Bacteroidetes-6]|jgi:carboxyl-terminal processing protease|nr:MAG: peptidase S41 [Bacteroidetes bacterium HGW-Bacteroidetes-6]